MRWSWFMPYHHFFIKRKQRVERKEREERERAFYENGSLLLEKLIVCCNAKPIPIPTFSPQHLLLATNNFSSSELLGVYVTHWYKGSLEGRIVLIKRFKFMLRDFIINDLVISAQMSGHSNVLKPIGCCLETPCPISVFEFAANGVLADRIYVSRVTELKHQRMVWERRLKIARQIAHALSYLHTAFPRPVIHMHIGEADVAAFFLNTPESKATVDKDSSLVEYIHNRAQGSCINEIVDPAILAEDGEAGVSLLRQLQAVVDLGLTCTEEDPQRRPTMVDITKQLRRIERFAQTGEVLLGNLQNLKLHESFEEHASASLKRNASSDEIQAVNEASERPLEV
ncbi:hypothetical protein ACB092_06G024400 [Castanea dentata]